MDFVQKVQAMPAGGAATVASVAGEMLTVGGVAFDLSSVVEGETYVPPDTELVLEVTRTGGVLQVTLPWQYDPATADPATVMDNGTVWVTSGPVPSPVGILGG